MAEFKAQRYGEIHGAERTQHHRAEYPPIHNERKIFMTTNENFDNTTAVNKIEEHEEYIPTVGEIIFEVCETLTALTDMLYALSTRTMHGECTTGSCFDFLAETAYNCKKKLLPYSE